MVRAHWVHLTWVTPWKLWPFQTSPAPFAFPQIVLFPSWWKVDKLLQSVVLWSFIPVQQLSHHFSSQDHKYFLSIILIFNFSLLYTFLTQGQPWFSHSSVDREKKMAELAVSFFLCLLLPLNMYYTPIAQIQNVWEEQPEVQVPALSQRRAPYVWKAFSEGKETSRRKRKLCIFQESSSLDRSCPTPPFFCNCPSQLCCPSSEVKKQ